jgi:hypothetical protein
LKFYSFLISILLINISLPLDVIVIPKLIYLFNKKEGIILANVSILKYFIYNKKNFIDLTIIYKNSKILYSYISFSLINEEKTIK